MSGVTTPELPLTPATAVRSALAEPTVDPPARWVAAIVLLNLGITSGWFGPIQVLLLEQAKAISPGHKEAVASLVLRIFLPSLRPRRSTTTPARIPCTRVQGDASRRARSSAV